MRKPYIFIFVFCHLLWNISYGQNLHLTHFSKANKLPSDQIRDVAQDTYGFFWIATDAGLLRFDGTDFKNFSHNIPSQYGRSFCQTPEGLLLSHDAGISLINPGLDTSKISTYIQGSINPDDQAIYYPGQLFLRKNGELWIAQPGGRISIFHGGKLIDVSTLPDMRSNSKTTACFAEMEDGAFWIAFSDGHLCRYDDENQTLEQVLNLKKINDLQMHNRELWIAGEDIVKLDFSEDDPQNFQTKTYHSDPGEVSTLSLNSQGNIYLGVKGEGLFYLDRRTGQSPEFIKVYSNNNPHSVGNLPFKNIHKIAMESDDRLWVCSDEGLGILQRRFFESLGSIPNANTTSVSVAENGKIFVSFGDIYLIEKADLGYEGHLLQEFSGGNVSALTAAKGKLWAGTTTGILFHLNQQGKILGSYDLRPRGEGVFNLHFDKEERLWVSQAPEERPLSGAGCLLPDGNFVEYGAHKGLFSQVLCFHETDLGSIYCGGVGAEAYLYRYLPEEDTFINLSLPLDFDPGVAFAVHDLSVDKNGVIWLATTNGLLRFDMEQTIRVHLDVIGIDTEIRAVTTLDDGSVWISTDTKGIIRHSETSSIMISEESGLPSEVMTYRCLVKEPGGRLWAGSSEGLVYSLDENPKPRKSNKPLLTAIRLDGKIIPGKEIKIFYNQQLTLDIISPSYHGYKTFYQYAINDGDWINMDTRRKIYFQDQKPGEYTISIRSEKEGGYLWSNPVTVDLLVMNYWYKRSVVLGSLGFIILIFMAVYIIRRKQKYSHNISELTRGLQMEKYETERKNADLEKAKDEIVFEQRQIRAQMFLMELTRRLISKITPGMKWDMVLEIISIDLLKFPGVIAFEIGRRNGKYLDFEGYSEHAKSFTTARVEYLPDTYLSAYNVEISKPVIYNNLPEETAGLSMKKEKRLDHYRAAVSVPFYLENNPAVLVLYAEKPGYFTKYGLKAIEVFATYLEQIY